MPESIGLLPREGEAASVPNAGERIVLGRVRQSALEGAEPDAPVEQVMEPGPSTVRPSMDARQLVERNLGAAIVTTPEGVLVGVFDRAEGERRLADLRA